MLAASHPSVVCFDLNGTVGPADKAAAEMLVIHEDDYRALDMSNRRSRTSANALCSQDLLARPTA